MRRHVNNGGAAIVVGFCALLGASTTVVNALALGLALFVTLLSTSVLLAASRRIIARPLYAPTMVVFFIGSVTAVQLLMAAAWPAVHAGLAPFLPLLAAGGLLLPCTSLFTAEQNGITWIANASSSGTVFLALATLLGGIRELAGHGFQLAVLLPGAFLALGLVAALYKGIAMRMRSS
jgi:Na+-translocating ferredoxin:NAD+ oxidoreductase subunit E